MGIFGGRKLSGGTASRAEVYGLFIASIVLVGGGVGGAYAFSASGGFAGTGEESATVDTPSATPDELSTTPDESPTETPENESPEPAPAQPPTREEQYHGAPVPALPISRTVPAPDVIGWTYDQVREWTQANLRRNPAWQDTSCFGSEYPPGTVARQSPRPGTLIVDDFDPVTSSASTLGIAIWMERDSYVGPNWYSEGPCVY
jgi:hypothetical protein